MKPDYIKNLEYQEKEYLDKIHKKHSKKQKSTIQDNINVLTEEEEKELKKSNLIITVSPQSNT